MPERFEDLRSSEDVEEILVHALRTEEDGRTLQERLRESARELGITDAALEQGAERWRAQRDRQAFDAWWRLKKRRRLVESITGMSTAAGICLVVDYFTVGQLAGRLSWSLLVGAILGVVLLARLFEAAFAAPSDRDFDRWRARQSPHEG